MKPDANHRTSEREFVLEVTPEPGEEELLAILEAISALDAPEPHAASPRSGSQWERRAIDDAIRAPTWPCQQTTWYRR